MLVADSGVASRRALRGALATAFVGLTIGEAGTVEQAMELARRLRWDVILIGASMPGMGDESAWQSIQQAAPAVPTLLVPSPGPLQAVVDAVVSLLATTRIGEGSRSA